VLPGGDKKTVTISHKRDFQECKSKGTPPDVCMTALLDRAIADEQAAQRAYGELISILPPTKENERTLTEIKNEEKHHEVELFGIKRGLELQREMLQRKRQ